MLHEVGVGGGLECDCDRVIEWTTAGVVVHVHNRHVNGDGLNDFVIVWMPRGNGWAALREINAALQVGTPGRTLFDKHERREARS